MLRAGRTRAYVVKRRTVRLPDVNAQVGPSPRSGGETLVAALGRRSRPGPKANDPVDVVRKEAKAHSNRIALLDWVSYSSGQSGWCPTGCT